MSDGHRRIEPWAWLQTLPFWATFGIVAAMAALILLPEFIIRAWDRKRIQRCQRQGMAR